ncbi:MAG: error-prone DNA polymerase [Rhodospirillaceae bacterium]|nr:error-prone DNA polymerase [Rhodospirillaceae bacterium]MBT5034105.1 error-prone DNA polymerase [Rhodospirillaceae bacterium]MBT6220997.1 error-prone DNA polymerase [Rhodospirillaceae bacterium]MBT6360883.1 error-prone DNA polymerase [Rhodospirillaceae bacterium]
MTDYAELQVTSNFTFLEGASHPDELVFQAAALGLKAIAITDRNSLSGVVRAHVAAKEAGLTLVVGARLDLRDGASLLALPMDRAAYGRLSRLITLGRRRAAKGDCELYRRDVMDAAQGMVLIVLPPEVPDLAFEGQLQAWRRAFPGDVYLAAQHLSRGDDDAQVRTLAWLADRCGVPLVATNDVLMHIPERRPLADVMTCIREGCTLAEAGTRVLKNAERHIKGQDEMAQLFQSYPDALVRTLEIAERCTFNLDELRYEYPDEITTDGRAPQEELIHLTWQGAQERYPHRLPGKVKAQIEHELELINRLNYAPYFLTVHDLVKFARSRDILCQGRGSAANSAVCFVLGITAVDPDRLDLLFERFISDARDEPPDIDVDFEHERREEVLQYIYEKYGRDRAGMTATIIHYRSRRAVREVGKVMGLSQDLVAALANQNWRSSKDGLGDDRIRELGLDPDESNLRRTLDLTLELIGFPRHLSQHVGGMVITRGRLDEVTPVENASMEDRTVIQWDKNDLDDLGILKVDVLGLGMLSCVRKGFGLIRGHYGKTFGLATVPPEDPAVYDMLCVADSIGVFQVESRAQMSFLPRMRPRTFYDLVIEVAIVRPGPIQGDMVHPYLRRRNGEEQVSFPSDELKGVLGKTLGVPLFQEQAMKVAVVAAGFTPSEADQLRRAMATFKHTGTIHTFQEKFINGMTGRGYDADFAARCFKQIEGFGDYGFPESHAASFALLVYVSAWMKRHYPAAFACALLNSQPMGFYAPAQIVRDLRDHGVQVRPPDINHSDWDSALELGDDPKDPAGGWALRLGFRQIKGLAQTDADWIVAARGNGYADPVAVWRRAGVNKVALEALARADAFGSLDLNRRQALWAVKPLGDKPLPLFSTLKDDDLFSEPDVSLPTMTLGEEVMEDYSTIKLSLKCHPLALLRRDLTSEGVLPNGDLLRTPDDTRVIVSGLVLIRQRPGTAKGVIFLTLEDETGVANIIVWADKFEAYRRQVLRARLIRIHGRLQRQGIVTHIVAHRIEDLSERLEGLRVGSVLRVPSLRDASG